MKSMTGYHSHHEERQGRTFNIEIKSVNSRYLELNIRLSHAYQFLEPSIRTAVQGHIQRGKVDVSLDIRENERQYAILVDRNLAAAYAAACREAAQAAMLDEAPALSTILHADGLIRMEPVLEKEQLESDTLTVLATAFDGFAAIRDHDGKSVGEDIRQNLEQMQTRLNTIREKTADSLPDLRRQLQERLERIVGKDVDQTMIITEAGILANKSDINEEISRLESHLALFETTMALAEPVGRTLDFISQEMNREVNTIGSKQSDYGIAEQVVHLKSDLEKIREQIRNIE